MGYISNSHMHYKLKVKIAYYITWKNMKWKVVEIGHIGQTLTNFGHLWLTILCCAFFLIYLMHRCKCMIHLYHVFDIHICYLLIWKFWSQMGTCFGHISNAHSSAKCSMTFQTLYPCIYAKIEDNLSLLQWMVFPKKAPISWFIYLLI